MVLPVLGSSSGAAVEQLVEQAVRGSANKLLFDVLYQLQKDAGKVPVVTPAARPPSPLARSHTFPVTAMVLLCVYHVHIFTTRIVPPGARRHGDMDARFSRCQVPGAT